MGSINRGPINRALLIDALSKEALFIGALPPGPPAGKRGRPSDLLAPRGRAAAGRAQAVAGADLGIV